MKIALTNRMALLSAAVAALAALVTAQAVPALTAHAQGQVLSSADFQQIALQGFGDRANSEAWSMAWFNDSLFVGTRRNMVCYKTAVENIISKGQVTYPPTDTDILCPPTIPDLPPTLDAQIWKVSPPPSGPITQSNWVKAFDSPVTFPVTVDHVRNVLAPREMGFRGMSTFADGGGRQELYISSVSLKTLVGKTATPPGLLMTPDGTTFTYVPSDPGTVLGDINSKTPYCCFRDSLAYKGNFYLAVTYDGGSGPYYVSPTPWLGDNAFQQYTPTSPVPMAVVGAAVFNNHLYLGTYTPKGYRVYRDRGSCTALPCPFSTFKSLVPPGGGLGAAGNHGVISMQVYTDTLGVPHLYVGTDGARNLTAAEVIRINTDDSWDLIVGNPRTVNGTLVNPLSGLGSGFGWKYNDHMWRMEVYSNTLYIGTYDNSTTFKDHNVSKQFRAQMGFDLYGSPDGTSMVKVTDNGFGDMFNIGARTMRASPYGLFLGSNNKYYGLKVYLGQFSPSGMALAARNLQVEHVPGGAALAWDAAPAAASYTVYRATLTEQALPALPAGAAQMDDGESDTATVSAAVPASTVWVPGADEAIGTTTNPYFVDTGAAPGGRYTYYVVAQDAQGDRSEPSNSAASPALAPSPRFRDLRALLAPSVLTGRLTMAQAVALGSALHGARLRLAAGDTAGCRDRLETLRGQIVGMIQIGAGQSALERLYMLADRLEKRVALVQAGVLDPASLT